MRAKHEPGDRFDFLPRRGHTSCEIELVRYDPSDGKWLVRQVTGHPVHRPWWMSLDEHDEEVKQ